MIISRKAKNNNKELNKIIKIIEKKKGIDTEVFEVSELSNITDFFIVTTALNSIHLKTLRDEVLKNIETDKRPGIDGKPDSGWIVLDYGDYILHLMVEEERHYYALEDIWSSLAKKIYHV